MKLDVNALRYLGKDEFRVLTAVEMGQKNHEIVPATLVDSIAGLKHGGTFKVLKGLLRHKLVHHDASKYDGYRLTTLGYDFLSIKTLSNRGVITGVGRQIGVGKESDVYEVSDAEGRVMALKLHRLGRTSFRAVKSKRDYMPGRGNHFSWLYLSRLAALKEFAFMKALGDRGLPVPEAIDCNRHAVIMSMVDGFPLVQVRQLHDPCSVYSELMELMSRLATLGLVHCDFNEFNIMINDEEDLTLIDFPQMVSASHANAKELFERDVECIIRFFAKKMGYVANDAEARPSFEEAVLRGRKREKGGEGDDGGDNDDDGTKIDEELRASGFKAEYQADLERFIINKKIDDNDRSSSDDGSEEEESSEEEEEEESSSNEEDDDISGSSEQQDDDDGGGGGGEQGDTASQSTREKLAKVNISKEAKASKSRAVAAKFSEQQKRAAKRAAMAKASRNAMKSRNKGKRKGEGGGGGGGWE
jgi:RIO kinase 2